MVRSTGTIKRIGLLGGGVIGAGWAARFLLQGLDVAVFDLDPEARRKIEDSVAAASRAYAKLKLHPLPEPGELRTGVDLEATLAGVDFVQESLPEREALKIKLLAQTSELIGSEVIVASSTSGLAPSRLQSKMKGPHRFVVGHPFNPVYLMPLVEICGGEQTSPETKTAVAEFYTTLGFRPLLLDRETDGFVADRLMEALWREALHLVNDGDATVEQIDDAMRFGPGLRWAFMGPFLTYRLAGGEGGMRHFMAQFGPTLKLPWTKLVAPELTDELVERIGEQSDQQAGGATIASLAALRDDCLVSLLLSLEDLDFGAGSVVKAFRSRLPS